MEHLNNNINGLGFRAQRLGMFLAWRKSQRFKVLVCIFTQFLCGEPTVISEEMKQGKGIGDGWDVKRFN